MTPPSDSIEAHAGTLREAVRLLTQGATELRAAHAPKAEIALDALADRVREAERERDEERGDFEILTLQGTMIAIAQHEYVEEAMAHGATRERAERAEAEAKALREALDWLIAWTSALIDDEWGKQTRPYTGSFEPFEEFLVTSESSDG